MTILLSQAVWSKSQAANFRECLRKGFYSQGEVPGPWEIEARRLKNIKNRYLWTGSILHEEIGQILKSVSRGLPLPEADEILDGVRTRMREALEKSIASKDSPERLFEHEHGIELPKEAWNSHVMQVERGLRWFLSSKWLARFKGLKPEQWKVIDEVVSFHVGEIKAYVKIDCGLELDGRFYLMDWKGSQLRGDDEEWAGVAALYAEEVWGAAPSSVQVFVVSVADGTSKTFQPEREQITAARHRIEKEAVVLSDMKSRWTGSIKNIPVASHIETCLRCNFQKLCFPNGVGHEYEGPSPRGRGEGVRGNAV